MPATTGSPRLGFLCWPVKMSRSTSIITADTINPAFKRIDYSIRGPLSRRWEEINEELAQGMKKPFDEVIVHYGDPQGLRGQKPLTFVRQVFALLACPDILMSDPRFPQDVKDRVNEILKHKTGHTMSSYTTSQGLLIIRKHIADYISRRDGYPSDPSNIFMTNGGSVAIQVVLTALKTGMNEDKREGIMIPIPQYSLYAAKILEENSYMIPYYLDEDNDWQLNIDHLQEVLDKARPHCIPRALVLINPGNPTGQVFSYKAIQKAIQFCHENRLVLFADEVYQDNIYTEEFPFYSCKKVLHEMGPEYKAFQLISLHSSSKGVMGECCSRSGYFELHGFDDETKALFLKKLTTSSCPNILGQVAMSLMCKPPQPGDESYELYAKERDTVLNSLRQKAEMTTSILNSLPGIQCNRVTGAMYAFPRITFPPKAICEAQRLGVEPDYLYASNLLEETGIFVVHGSGFGQKAGTSHFRITIIPPLEETTSMFERFSKFHQEFISKYS